MPEPEDTGIDCPSCGDRCQFWKKPGPEGIPGCANPRCDLWGKACDDGRDLVGEHNETMRGIRDGVRRSEGLPPIEEASPPVVEEVMRVIPHPKMPPQEGHKPLMLEDAFTTMLAEGALEQIAAASPALDVALTKLGDDAYHELCVKLADGFKEDFIRTIGDPEG